MPSGPPAPRKVVRYRYTITFKDGGEKRFQVDIDAETLALIESPRESYPEWTQLTFHKCPNCPLDEARHERCPVAASLVDVVEAFKDSPSYEEVDVTVQAANRSYLRHGALQTAVSSLLGLHMVTAGCPILNKLRPMVDMHLPFMSRDETMFRMIAMYVMSQFFRQRAGEPADWELTGLGRHLEEIRTVNVAFCRRLNAIPMKDASVNALVILSTLGDFPARLLTKKDLARIERIYRQHYG